MHINIQHFLHLYGYWAVFFILLIEMVGIPFPAETTLTLSGFEWSVGSFHIIPLLLVAGFGNIVGSSIAYWIGRLLGRPFIERFGKYVGLTSDRLDKANESFHRFQSWIVILGKFIAGIRVLIPYLAGINKMNFLIFSILNAISAFLWATAFVVLGKTLGHEWKKYHAQLHHYLIPGIIVIIVLIGVYIFIKRRRKKRG